MEDKLLTELYKGQWDNDSNYTIGDIVTHSGSSYVALTNNTQKEPGMAPDWGLLAHKGEDQVSNLGDVVGPEGAIEHNIAIFDGETGKLIKDSSKKISDLMPATEIDDDPDLTDNSLEKLVPQKTIKTFVENRIRGRNIANQVFINGGCEVAQRTAPTITNSYQYGEVDRFAAKATATSIHGGTISRSVTPSVSSVTKKALKLSNVIITGDGALHIRYRIESNDSVKLRNKKISVGCNVYHDVGSNINYSIYFRKPTAIDNYTSTEEIASLTDQSVENAKSTLIKYEAVEIGDCSKGLELEIRVSCGPVSGKNFEFADFQLNTGDTLLSFTPKSYSTELASCYRYYQQSITPFASYSGCHSGLAVTNATLYPGVKLPVEMRAPPIVTIFSAANTPTLNKISPINTQSEMEVTPNMNGQSTTKGWVRYLDATGPFTVGNWYWYNWKADAEL